MKTTPLHIGSNIIHPSTENAETTDIVEINGQSFYKIQGFNHMETFFMTIVSSTDQWMFIASNGSLSAGRKNPESALFPYYTDDKIIDSRDVTGSKTLIKVLKDNHWHLWEPFSERYYGMYKLQRNIYKNKLGSHIIFEEINSDLGLSFTYSWSFSKKYGFVKTSEITNLTSAIVHTEVLDGLRNLLPYGVNLDLQTSRSTLVDAYKKNELDTATGLGVFSLSSMIVDRAEPSEALKATTVWSKGLEQAKFLLSTNQLNDFRKGNEILTEEFIAANKAAYFVNAKVDLAPKAKRQWLIVAEVNQSTANVVNLNHTLASQINIIKKVQKSRTKGDKKLQKLVGKADGLQLSNHALVAGRHFSNVLFNIMRGGIFEKAYTVNISDFKAYLKEINPFVFDEHQSTIDSWGSTINYIDLKKNTANNINLNRISVEYLPLLFSRRHGDPSRPWNNFNIDLYHANGDKKLNYEGNWRDIFQNWEALTFSYPHYIFGIITKFVNASTIDGYNPYRITREGIDWETIEPDNPWSYIGYWGDHQVIYLQKLLELAEQHFPHKLSEMLGQNSYVYANVPYRIKGYDHIISDPNNTIDFDDTLAKKINEKVATHGADGKLIWKDHKLLTATFAEKLLVMMLTKLYNFVPNGGIWLNTQRPEWNDANNALVGNGLSLVTLNYLRRFLTFIQPVFKKNQQVLEVHVAVANLLQSLRAIFTIHQNEYENEFTPESRRAFIDACGKTGEEYRTAAYQGFAEGTTEISSNEVANFIQVANQLIESTLTLSRRADGLYHSYNLLHLSKNEANVSYLYEMLEGQVAALSSGLLGPEETLGILNNLKTSKMYRADQYSYMLYPNRKLKPFLEKNNLPKTIAKTSQLLQALIKLGNTQLIEKDQTGGYHFAGELKNEADLKQVLTQLKQTPIFALVEQDEQLISEAFEDVFNHISFTGRSGTFYGYEGLGSIYWHMVSKLLLAVQENINLAHKKQTNHALIGKLKEHYYEIRAGIGINKSPQLYGAFPTDAYSHTPSNAGAQQPGMTGQVKEDIINRWAELGIQVCKGGITINPIILDWSEFLDSPQTFEYLDNNDEFQLIELTQNQLGFTYCGILFIFEKSDKNHLELKAENGTIFESTELFIPQKYSQLIFARSTTLHSVLVYLKR